MVLLQRKLYFPRIQRGPTFPGGGGGGSIFFRGGGGGGGGGVQMLISIEPHITCDFPGWVWTPYIPPLDPHMDREAVKADRTRSLNMRTDNMHMQSS